MRAAARKRVLVPPLFGLGIVVSTPGALETFPQDFLVRCLSRHVHGDWGDLDADDKQTNADAVQNGGRILSAYAIEGKKLWIITEADRSSTCALLPSEY